MLCLCTQRRFDGGRPGADCLTPQLRTNGHLATDYERSLLKSVADSQGYAICGEDRRLNVDHCRRCYTATMISGGADALTIHWDGTDDFSIVALPGLPGSGLADACAGEHAIPTRRRRTAGGSGTTGA